MIHCLLDWPATQEFPVAQKFSYAGYGKKKFLYALQKKKNVTLKGYLRVFPKLIMDIINNVRIMPSYYFFKVTG